MTAYYNEIDPQAAAWLRELITQGHVAAGIVDTRSIEDVTPNDLMGFTQCHFFAGIGGWSRALRLAGWPDDRAVWTGSCPCQPFSDAGKGAGFADKRHLWPTWYNLIKECRPRVVFGEQVASKDGLMWLDLVQANLEAEAYAFAPFDLCAAGVGSPQRRQRLWFIGSLDYTADPRRDDTGQHGGGSSLFAARPVQSSSAGTVAHADGGNASAEREQRSGEQRQQQEDSSALRMANPDEQLGDEGCSDIGGGHQRSDAQPRARPGRSGEPVSVGDALQPGLPQRESVALFGTRGGGMKGEQLNNQAVHLLSGQTANGSTAPMEKPGQLNPAHSRWLMGYPPEWDACAVTAMPSSRKSQQK